MEKDKNEHIDDKVERKGKLYTIDDLPENDQHNIYMPNKDPKHKIIWDKVKEYNEAIKPKNWKDWASIISFGHGYFLWKLPPHIHQYVNKVLKYAAEVGGFVQPEVGVALGLEYGISQAIYGLKTRSGKHVGAGIGDVVNNLKKVDTGKLKPFLNKVEDILGTYFHKFDEAKATA